MRDTVRRYTTGLAAAAALLVTVLVPARAGAEPPELTGRLFARQSFTSASFGDEPGVWQWTQSVASARLAAKYSYRDTVKTEVEVEFSDGKGKIRDAYVRYRPTRAFSLKAGRFKKPISAVQLEGLWSLPVIERGLLDELQFGTVSLPIGGRGDGIELALDLRDLGDFPVELQLVMLQSDILTPLDVTEDLGADLYARATFAVTRDVDVGATFGWIGYLEKPERGTGFRHAPVSGIDVTVTDRFVRVWAEVIAGIDTLPFAIDVATLDLPCSVDGEGNPVCPPFELIADRGLFVAARAVASLRFRPGFVRILEPFAAVTVLDLNTKFTADEARQFGGGITAYFNKRLRAQLQVDRTTAKSDAPVADTTRVLFQLGSSF